LVVVFAAIGLIVYRGRQLGEEAAILKRPQFKIQHKEVENVLEK